MKSCVRRSLWVTMPCSVELTNAARTFPGRSGSGNASAGNSSCVVSCQFSANACCISRTAGPRTRTLLSRHDSPLTPSPRHLSSMPNPPVIPTRPSTRTILRWLRARSSWPGTGRERRTLQPAPVSGATSSSVKERLPTASTRIRHCTPARARAAIAVIRRFETSPSAQMKLTIWMLRRAFAISATMASKTFPLLMKSTEFPDCRRTAVVW